MDNGHAELTEVERLKLENFALKHNAIQQQLNANLAARTAFIEALVAAHPGYQWIEQQGLVKSSEAATDRP